VIADISGYTNYVTRVELDHAQSILTNLLDLIKDSFQPRLQVRKFEGDAVFAYAPETRMQWKEGLSELLEATYARFRGATGSMRRQTTCECNACRAIPSLDLKFIAHYGEYIEQDVSGAKELLGSDVILAHRLLKNQVFARTGWNAYLLFTEACLHQLGIRYPQMHEYVESYEHFGDVPVRCADLHVAYREALDARRSVVKPEEADGKVVVTIRAPRQEVWEWLNDPQKRLLWEKLDIRPVLRPMGRISVGARSHCYHGNSKP
jgi:Adenylate cyclase, family 3 (some proteins contain HAMP domain)